MTKKGEEPKVKIDKHPVHVDEFVYVTHLDSEPVHLEHNPKTGEYRQTPCDCSKEEVV